jgi:hypothetical protein
MYRVVKSFFEGIGRNKILLKYSLLTNTAFGVLLRAGGDIIQQGIENNNSNKNKSAIDWSRTSNMNQFLNKFTNPN